MPALQFNSSIYARPGYGTAPSRLQNFFVEIIDQETFRLLPRPGLLASSVLGSGPIRLIWRQLGLLDGAVYVVSGGNVYKGGALIGTIGATGPISVAASYTQMVITSGGLAYLWDGTTFAQITDPDLPSASWVAYFGGQFVYCTVGSDTYYWSAVNDAGNIDGLAFATAEQSPDPNQGVLAFGDELVFCGADTIEFWTYSGNANAPFIKIQLRSFLHGVAAMASVVLLDNTFFFVGKGDEGWAVFRAENQPIALSDPTISQALAACDDLPGITSYVAGFGGHLFYVLNIPGQGSFAYDVTTKLWAEWTSYRQPTFRGLCAEMIDGVAYVGDFLTGQVWTLDTSTFLDGTEPITRLASAFTQQLSGKRPFNRVMLECARGVETLTGQGVEPYVELRYSDDRGNTWSTWRQRFLGKQGNYRTRAIWDNLGTVIPPGRHYEFRVTDPVVTTFDYLMIDEKVF